MIKPYYQDNAVTIYHGDCLEVLPAIGAETVDMIWTDPPYGHSNHDGDWNSRLNEHRGVEQRPIANDDADGMRVVVDGMLREAVRVLKHDCCCCCGGGGGPRPTFAWVANRMDSDGLSFFHSVIWDKVNPGLGWRYRRQHEMVMVSHRNGGRLSWNDAVKAKSNVVRMSKPRDTDHPNIKPLELVAGFIEAHTTEGQTILDPFAGSGTTGRAAKDLGRKATLIEREEKYCEIAAKRMAQEVLSL